MVDVSPLLWSLAGVVSAPVGLLDPHFLPLGLMERRIAIMLTPPRTSTRQLPERK